MSSQSATSTSHRLSALAQGGRSLSVDRTYPGKILGLSVITTGPALGHGFDVDRKTVAQVSAALEGRPGRWTHGGLSEDGLARHLGRWTNARSELFALCRDCPADVTLAAPAQAKGDEPDPEDAEDMPECPRCGRPMEVAARAVADFHFTKTAHSVKPDGLDSSAPDYIMDRAEEDPSSLGISIVAEFRLETRDVIENGEKVDEKTVGHLAEHRRALSRADWVADPAANPVGLHAGTGAPSEVIEAATHQLTQIEKRLGRDEAYAKALAFLDRHFGRPSVADPKTSGAAADAASSPMKPAETVKATDHTAELTALRAKNEALESAVKALQADKVAREKKAADDYVATLSSKAVSLGSPIPQGDLDKVTALLAAGNESIGHDLGDAYLKRSEALGASFGRSSQSTTLGASRAGDEAEIDKGVTETLASLGVKTKKGA